MTIQIIRNDELSYERAMKFESRRELAVQTRGAIGLDLIFCSTFASRQKWKKKQMGKPKQIGKLIKPSILINSETSKHPSTHDSRTLTTDN